MFEGNIVKGDGKGKGFGYPTANLDCKKIDVRFSEGIYAAHATLERSEHRAALIIRENPWKVEVHLLDFPDTDIYGKVLAVEPHQKVSSIEPYESVEELKKKIHDDIQAVRAVLEE